MSVQAISQFFNLGLDDWQPTGVELPSNPLIDINGEGLSEQEILSKAVLATYDIRNDDKNLRENVSQFEQQRGDYPTRREFPAYTVRATNVEDKTLLILENLGFKIEI